MLFDKRIRAVATLVEDVSDTRVVRVFGQTDAQGKRLMQSATVPGARRIESGTKDITFRQLRVRFDLLSDDDTMTPKLKAHTWEVAPEPPRYRQWQLRVRCVRRGEPTAASRCGRRSCRSLTCLTPADAASHSRRGMGGKETSVLMYAAESHRDPNTGESIIAITLVETGGEVQSVGMLAYNSGLTYNSGLVYP